MVTVDQLLTKARQHIFERGWATDSWPVYRPGPMCIRAGIYRAAVDLRCRGGAVHLAALRRVSEAIYREGTVGGISEWEYRKRIDKAAVIAMLDKAIGMGPGEKRSATRREGAV